MLQSDKTHQALRKIGTVLLASVLVFFAQESLAYDGKPAPKVADEKPQELENVGIDEKLGGSIDLTLKVKNEKGEEVTLGSFFDGKHPIIFSPVYFNCPGLCNFHLNGLTDALKLMDKDWTVGKKYQVVAFSFDSKETPEQAAGKKTSYMDIYGRPESESAWHFTTANEDVVQKLTQSVGFKFKWDEAGKEWAHASAAIVITPDGKISRYLPGITFNPQDIKIALNEATDGKIGSIVDSLVLYCFKYDPSQSKYTLVAFNLMKVGGAIMVLVMVIWLLPVWLRGRKENSENTAGR